MAKLSMSPLTQLSGKIGRVVYRKLNGEMIVQAMPDKKKKMTPHQKLSKEQFLAAVGVAKRLSRDPIMRPLYAARVSKWISNPYTVAMRDCLNPPEVVNIYTHNYTGELKSRIVIEAIDDFKVKSVHVKIMDNETSSVIEEGDAINIHSNNMWYYVSTVENKNLSNTRIVATAKDYPGNTAMLERKI